MLTDVQAWIGRAARPFGAEQYDAAVHERLRLTALLAIAFFKLCNFVGATWDIQWHVAIGRDSLWIPPHLVVILGYVGGAAIAATVVVYESHLARAGAPLRSTVRLGGIVGTPGLLGAFAGYYVTALAGLFDEFWHRRYGLDVTLWSPPHILIMVGMTMVDVSLMVGLAASTRRLNLGLAPRSPFLWGTLLVGAFTFEAANFQLSEAFIAGYAARGAGLMGLLFPILMGTLYPMTLVLALRLAGRYWIALPIALLTLVLQYASTGLAALGFAILQPVSVADEYVRQNPQSTLALAREFARLNGFTSLIGFQQAWVMWLSAIPLALVSLLDLWPRLRQHVWVAAPVYSASLVVTCYIWFQFTPVMRTYGMTWFDAGLSLALAVGGGLVMARVGLWLARRAEPAELGAPG